MEEETNKELGKQSTVRGLWMVVAVLCSVGAVAINSIPLAIITVGLWMFIGFTFIGSTIFAGGAQISFAIVVNKTKDNNDRAGI